MGESKTTLFVVLILILWKGRSGRMQDDFFIVLIMILWKRRSRRINDNFGCHSYMRLGERGGAENQR